MKNLKFSCLIPIIIFVLFNSNSLYSQSIYYVNASALPGGDGQSWSAAFTNLQQALDVACVNSPAQIWIAANTYFPSQNPDTTSTGPNDRTNTFSLCNDVAIYGGFAGTETQLEERDWINNPTILSGDIDHDDTIAFNANNIITAINLTDNVVIDGLIITGGNANAENFDTLSHAVGGGMLVISSTVQINNCSFIANSAREGAGMYNDTSTLHLNNCAFKGNYIIGNFGSGAGISNYRTIITLVECRFDSNIAMFSGGGMDNAGDCNITMHNCSFNDNVARRGAGFYSNFSCIASLTSCTFNGNVASTDGGAIFINDYSIAILDDCTMTNNETGGGGGAFYSSIGAQSRITNCLISGNTAWRGGGIYNQAGSRATLINTKLTGNHATSDGGGYFSHEAFNTLINTVISSNVADEEGGGLTIQEGTLKLINSTISGNIAGLDGGGLFNRGTSGSVLVNNIIWNNQAFGDISISSASIFNDGVTNVDISYSIVANSGGSTGWDNSLGTDHGNNIDSDPLFIQNVDLSLVPVPTGDLHLQPGSPAINAGSLDTSRLMIPGIDHDGNPRFIHGRIDIGAYEFQGLIALPECMIIGKSEVIATSVDTFTAPAGMTGYAWAVSGNATITSSDTAPSVIIQAGSVDGYWLTLTSMNSDSVTSTCAWHVRINIDCSVYDTFLYVKQNATGANNGTSWHDAFRELQDALRINCPGVNQIWVAAGIYKPDSIYRDREATFLLKDNLAIYGGFAGHETSLEERDILANPTTLNGDVDHEGSLIGNSYSVVTSLDNQNGTILDGFIISGGNAEGFISGDDPYSGGGGIFIMDGNPTISNCTLTFNTANSGGGMLVANASPSIANCTFTHNTTSRAGLGGGMMNSNNSAPHITDCIFMDNTAVFGGGGMANINSTPLIHDCTFLFNNVSSSIARGGGMYNGGSSPQIISCLFKNNSVAGNGTGGGLYNTDSSPLITGTTFEDNLARRGGGMYNMNSSPTLTFCNFYANETRSGGLGGGICNFAGSAPLITRCLFSDNFGYDYGGGMYNENSSPVLNETQFWRNTSFEWGGGGMANRAASPVITDCVFHSNMAYLWGGGMYNLQGSEPVITNSYFGANNAALGGGISLDESSPVITNSMFENNDASADGGGIYCWRNSAPLIINSIFKGNTAGQHGGALYADLSSPMITTSTISGNRAGIDGGGIYNLFHSFSHIINTIIWNNRIVTAIDTSSESVANDSTSTAIIAYSLVAHSGGSENWNGNIGDDLGGNIDSDPLFVRDVDLDMLPDSLADFHLLMASPAINAGTPDTTGLILPPTDYDGNPRIFQDRIDMGAYEYQQIVSVETVNEIENTLQIFPNPATESIHIVGQTNSADIILTNELGQTISVRRKMTSQDGIYSINISHLPSGTYLVQLIGEDREMLSGKISVVRK